MMELRIAEMLVDIRFDDPMEQAAYMLRRLEKAGMKPPEILREYDTPFTTSGILRIPENRWEPEDET
jgi:hypothetical protein